MKSKDEIRIQEIRKLGKMPSPDRKEGGSGLWS